MLHNIHTNVACRLHFFLLTGHAPVLMSFFLPGCSKTWTESVRPCKFWALFRGRDLMAIQWLLTYAVCLFVCDSCRSTETWGAPSLQVTTPFTRRRCRWLKTGRSPAGCWGTGIKEPRPTCCVRSSISKNNIFLWIFHVLRTEWFECHGDVDFLAKLHCVREACQVQFNPLK